MSFVQLISLNVVRDAVARLGAAVYGDSNKSVLPFIPRPIRYLLVLLLVVNGRSFPFAWHYRLFSPIVLLRMRWWFVRLFSRKSRGEWLDSLQPIGRNPFAADVCKLYKSWASPDDSDYNFHMSNSSYAKTLDSVRVGFALDCFLAFFRDGGWIALGGTHFNFIREIPIGARYEVRSTVGCWDGKWLYLISRFISTSTRANAAKTKAKQRIVDAQEASQDAEIPTPSIHAPAENDALPSGSTTPAVNAAPAPAINDSEGETLHCIAVSQLCYKIGRITVPPALVLASNGFGLSTEKWQEMNGLRTKRSSVNPEKKTNLSMRDLLKGAWKDVPTEDRWWDQALAGWEEERRRGLEVLSRLKTGIEGARSL